MRRIFVYICMMLSFCFAHFVFADSSVLLANEPAETQDVEGLLEQRIVERYTIQILGILDELEKKLASVDIAERQRIVGNIERNIRNKYDQINEIENISFLRKKIVLQIFNFILAELEARF